MTFADRLLPAQGAHDPRPGLARLTPGLRRVPTLAAMLQATSLAAQADLRASLQARDFPFHYLCGERDAKFRAIAQTLAADLHLIHHAGHNAHRDNPAAVIACLAQILAS